MVLGRGEVERLVAAMTTEGWRQAISSMFTTHTPDVISDLRCPIAILAGALDRVAPYEDHARHLLAAAPWAKPYLFEGCGHILKPEAPAKFNSVVRQMVVEHKTMRERACLSPNFTTSAPCREVEMQMQFIK